VLKTLSVVALAAALAACALKAHHAPVQNPGESVRPVELGARGKLYRIDEGQSELRVLVYRAGPLARLGHNHVILNRAIRGGVSLGEGLPEFRLTVPAAAFVVDDALARREEGPDFATEIPDEAKSGTLRNMLGTALLDADEFPVITLNSVAVTASQEAPDLGSMIATVVISVAGHESTVHVPFMLRSEPKRLSATGSLGLRQSDLGLTPYSLMLGALQVQDLMTVKFTIVAVPG